MANKCEQLSHLHYELIFGCKCLQFSVCGYSVLDILSLVGTQPEQGKSRQALRLCMVYKLPNGLADLGTQQLMHPQRRPSRHVNCIGCEVPFSRTNYHQMSFVPRTIRDWNSLPDSVVRAPSLEAFNDGLWFHFANSH